MTLRDPPWILKRFGLESSGQRLISSTSKTQRKAFYFFCDRKYLKKNIFDQIFDKTFRFSNILNLFFDFWDKKKLFLRIIVLFAFFGIFWIYF